MVSLAAAEDFGRGDRGRFLPAFLGDIIDVMEPIVAWKKAYLAGSSQCKLPDAGKTPDH